MPDGPSVIKFDSFKADILAEAAFTDYWGVWEPFWWLVRGGKVVEGEPEDASAERALRELHADGLLFFFRVPGDRPVKACGEDAALRLTPSEVLETLRGDWWRSRDGLPEAHPEIWFGVTDEGASAAAPDGP